jgi:PAS domain S-box-containing protein
MNPENKRDAAAYISPEKQQGFLYALLENVEEGIVACDAEGILTIFNYAARAFHGLTEEPLAAEHWPERYDLYYSDGRTRMKKEDVPLYRALQGEHIRDVEMVIAPKEGRKRTVLVNGRAIYGAQGEKLGAVVVMRDFTEQKAAQEALKQESSLMQTLMENIPDAIYFKDCEGRFTRVNRHAPFRGNHAPEEVIGKTDFDFFLEEHARQAREDEQRIVRTGQPIVDKEEKEVYPDGSFTWLSTTKAPIFDEAGRVTGIVGISRDITSHKLAEAARLELIREQAARAEAEAANRIKDEFLAVVSHELRTPLTAILGWANLLITDALEDKEQKAAIEAVIRNARAQVKLIDDLLDVSRIITGKFRLDLKQADPALIIEAAVEALMPAAEAKGVRVQKVMDTSVGHVVIDPQRVQQIVWNLVANAIKFTPEGGRIEVRLGRSESEVEIVVTDTGSGIKPEFLPHVFDRFRQADQSTTRKHGGLGIGLAIVRHLAELHGGSVQAESDGDGQGAAFTVRLPLISAHESDGTLTSPRRKVVQGLPAPNFPERLDGLRVLVVDDELDMRELLRTGLAQCGAEVVSAGSAAEAIKAIRAAVPDLLISDIGMPQEDGYDLIRQVRGLPAEAGGNVPAIALTAYARTEDRLQALRAGYQMHVPKPVELSELVAVTASLARRNIK